jgi:hypothetical protein
MAGWSGEELDRLEAAEELQLATLRGGRGLSSYTTMWVVRVGADVFVRSAGGSSRPWFRRAMANGSGRVRTKGVQRDVTFELARTESRAKVDAAYHSKYDRYGENIVGRVVGPNVESVTLRLVANGGPTENL